MRILFYNWTGFDGRAGGGVSVYLRNIIPELLRRGDVEIWFLSSGEHYGVLKRRPYIEEVSNIYSDRGVRSFRIINSPVKAPAHDAFYAIDTWRENAELFRLIRKFMRDHGPFDVFHLHSLEGISGNVISMGNIVQDTKVFFTLHNYMPYCPQIELLHANARPCVDFREGTKCVGCLGERRDMGLLIARQRLSSSLNRHGLAGHPIGNFLFGMAEGFHQIGRALRFGFLDTAQGVRDGFRNWFYRRDVPSLTHMDKDTLLPMPEANNLQELGKPAEAYASWRRTNAALLQRSVSRVFAVSQLVKDSVARIGENTGNIEVLPLAMDVHATSEEMRAVFDAKPKSDMITISFIGYNIPSKGLPFLLKAFDSFDDDFLKNNVRLLVFCRMNARGRRQLYSIRNAFREVRWINGYNRENLPGIAQHIDLNIVPSIWPETFNQVTFELMALGTPSLLSSNVGAKQLFGQHPAMSAFVFQSSSVADFRAKLMPLVKSQRARRSFFEHAPALPTLEEHVDRLVEAYKTYPKFPTDKPTELEAVQRPDSVSMLPREVRAS